MLPILVFIIFTWLNPAHTTLDSLYAQLDPNCEHANSFVCRNSKCITIDKRCDGKSDCTDSSDEEDCDLFHCKPPNYFKCNNGKCTFSSFICDDENDCGDYSDESNCTNFKVSLEHLSKCNKDEWQCADKLCIPKDFVCNGDNDCLDGTDETVGCTVGIECDGFKCSNGHCIPNEWRCDGNDDCHDNTDEINCHSHIKPKDCKLESKLFLCSDNNTCLNLTNVCDKTPHCPDKSDEGSLCSLNDCANHKCSHDCVQLPTGAKCVCPHGYETIDDFTCRDINECEIYGICDQKCKNTAGSYECYCDDKYELQDDKKTCKVFGGEAMMIFSAKTEIRGYFLQSQLLFSVAKQLRQVIGVSYDGHHVYWTDIFQEHESLIRSMEDGSEQELLVTSGIGTPEDLAVDWITGNIYFTDSEMHHIAVCSNDGKKCTVLVNKDIHSPRGIVLHPKVGKMYWSDWENKSEIARSNMDGSEDIAFVSNDIHWPNGLAIDYPNERLYWTDAKLLTLESIRLDGTDRRIILEGIVKHPYAIAVFEDRLYWSDLNTRSIQSCNKFTGKNHTTLVKEKRSHILGVHIFHSALKPRSVNPCALSYCSDICLISGPNTYSCACPQDKTLSSDKHTCKESFKKQVLIVGAHSSLFRIEHQLLGQHDIKTLPTYAKEIGSLTYNPVKNELYISDISAKKIVLVNLSSGKSKPILTENIGVIKSMDYDYLGNNLYWCDSEKKTVEILNLATLSRKVIIHDMHDEIPMSIALVPEEGVMFIAKKHATEIGVHIDRLPMDGSSQGTHVIESGLVGPIELHYDMGLHRVFWADAGTGNIESTSADGDDRHGFKALHAMPISITSLSKDIFWTTYQSKYLFWAPKDNIEYGMNKKLVLKLPDEFETLHLVSVTPYIVPDHYCQENNGGCSHLCLISHKNAKCACPLGMGLGTDNKTCIVRTECTSNEFYCFNTDTCIPKALRCNGRPDCMTGEDEENCAIAKKCPSSYFQCKNGECIRDMLRCDMHFDCTDKSDEIDCDGELINKCPLDYFKCSDDKCLNNRFLCDGVKDCSDGEDEINCESASCSVNEFRCFSGMCIPKSWECDLEYDCIDNSDEHAGCATRLCESNQFKCDNGLCIDSTLKCNNINDCGDSSDERSCEAKGMFSCGPNEFQCISDTSMCIPEASRCNGISECPHHEDEQGCSDCHIDEYECRNKKCIPAFWICDKNDDCGDNSDEEGCFGQNGTVAYDTNALCDNGFRCKSGACIDYALVCNGQENCYDGSDENGACNSSCKSHPCQQKCQPTPTGAMCLCKPGYELAGDGITCKDVAECSRDPPTCSQFCTEEEGGFLCSCYDGFMIRSDKTSCKSKGEAMSLFFNVDNEIRLLSQTNNSLKIIHAEETPKITGLDVDTSQGYVYFSIEESQTLHRINLYNSKRDYIMGVGKAQKIAFDWITKNLYYADAESTQEQIRICNFDQKICANVISVDKFNQISAIAVDAVNKYLFYSLTSWFVFNNPHSIIYKTNLDGSKRHELVKTSASYITGMTYDSNTRVLYYTDELNGLINRIKYDGTDKVSLLSNLSKPTGLSLFEDHLYYLTNHGLMNKCRLYGSERTCTTYKLNTYNSDLFAISQTSRQPQLKNKCAHHECQHLCIPSELGVRCLCENGKVVPENQSCPKKDVDLNQRKSEFATHIPLDDDSTSSTVAAIIIPILMIVTAGVVYLILKRKTSGNFNVSVRFNNPVYGLGGETCESTKPMLVPGEHEYFNPTSVNEEFQKAANSVLEKVTPLIKIDN